MCIHFKHFKHTCPVHQFLAHLVHQQSFSHFTTAPCSSDWELVALQWDCANTSATLCSVCSSVCTTQCAKLKCAAQCASVQSVQGAECIVEVHVQDAKGVGVIRGCKGPTFHPILLSSSNGVRAHILCGLWICDRKPSCPYFCGYHPRLAKRHFNIQGWWCCGMQNQAGTA